MNYKETQNETATYGDKSKSTHDLQKQLNKLGAGIQEDSMYGPKTQEAFEKYQDKLVAPKDDYTSAIKDEFGTYDTPKEADLYGMDKTKADLDTYKTNRESAYNDLKDLRASSYDDEYTKRDLGTKKTEIDSIDSQINEEKKLRDDELYKIRSNRGLSASQMTGDIKKVADYQNNVINNLIEQRNGLSNAYNGSLGEIDKMVENSLKDKSLDYQYWDDLYNEADKSINEYSTQYREQLADTQDQSNFEKQLAQALSIATMNSSDGGSASNPKLQLITDALGNATATFNPYTGAITKLDPGEEGEKPFDPFAEVDVQEEEESGKPGFFKRILNAIKGK